MEYLYKKLIDYKNQPMYPMHMPGHKRNSDMLSFGNPYELDITEIQDFDNLHHAEGVLFDLSRRIAKLYGANRSYPLVNGSTAGILAGISAATDKGDKVLVARNAHKSVYHGIIMRELKPKYLYPQKIDNYPVHGGILASDVKEALIKDPDIKLVILTSPTYEGIVSNIEAIAKVVHEYGAQLLVDEAHGAHFGFHKAFPKSAVCLGADLVIQSTHKTLPAFTQTALLHLNNPQLVDRVEMYLEMYQSSSPSYLLLASIDRCVQLLSLEADTLFETFHNRLERFYQSLTDLKNLYLLDRKIIGRNGVYQFDSSKITILILNHKLNGHELHLTLRQDYQLEMEMESRQYVLGMTSICDTEEGFLKLNKALRGIDQRLGEKQVKKELETEMDFSYPTQYILPWETLDAKKEEVDLWKSEGKVCGAAVSLFPPGSPLIVPGEIITEELIRYIQRRRHEGFVITGLYGSRKEKIMVLC